MLITHRQKRLVAGGDIQLQTLLAQGNLGVEGVLANCHYYWGEGWNFLLKCLMSNGSVDFFI